MLIEVFADGSATVETKPGGYGYVICIDGQKIAEGSGYMEKASNNDAELEAAIRGLAKVLQMRLENKIPIGDHEIYLVSDSQIILGWANGNSKFRQKHKIHKFEQLQYVVKKLNAKTRWVQGHSGDIHNERCDKLANAARKRIKLDEESLSSGKLNTKQTLIGKKKINTLAMWVKGVLKIVDFEKNIVEDYNKELHGTRGSFLSLKE